MRLLLLNSLFFLCFFLVSGCTKKHETLFQYRQGFSVDVSEEAQQGIFDMGFGKFDEAHRVFNHALRFSPSNCQINFLNALAYHLQGGKGDVKKLDLAQVGYQISLRFCPTDPWPHYYYGLLLSKQKRYSEAEQQFKLAVQYNRNKYDQKFLDDYLISSFNSGDFEVASHLIRDINRIDPDDKYSKLVEGRIHNLLTRTPTFSKAEWRGMYEKLKQKQKYLPHSKKQLLVDAVIILSQERKNSLTGINLFNGLQMTYALSEAFSKVNPNDIFNFMRTSRDIFGTPTTPSMNTLPFSSIVTNMITTPAITYSLNIFNQDDEKDEILARPNLLVQDGGKAVYFSGNQLILGIQGTQTGSITEKNIGVDLEVSPKFQKNGSIDLNVKVSRTFLRPTTAVTTFQQVAETIKQDTHTQVNLRFGETVILSALTESIQTDNENMTPLLGRLPLIKYLFNAHTKTKTNNNVLILLTPRPYISLDTNVYNKRIEQQLNKVYHSVINPGTNISRVLAATQTMRSIYRPITLTASLYDPSFLKHATDQEYQMLTEEVQ